MKKVTYLAVAVAVLAVVAMVAQPAYAGCGSFRQINSTGSYVITPGYCTNGAAPCDNGGADGSSVSAALEGSFWHVGNGNPTVGLGNDSGSVAAFDTWVYVYSEYPAVIKFGWNEPGVDGCIDNPLPASPTARCMAAVLTDVDSEGAPVFAIMTAAADAGLNYSFEQPSAAPINLAPLPKLSLLNTVRTGGGTGVDATVSLAGLGLEDGLYLAPGGDCTGVGAGGTNLVAGYRARRQNVPRGAAAPSDPDTSNWSDCGAGVTPVGQQALCSVPCGGNQDTFISYSLVLDSGFELGVVGANSTRVECGATVADPDSRIRIRKPARTEIRTR